MKKTLVIIPNEKIEKAIFLIRGQKVMLDRDLAILYGVTTGALNQAVRRNQGRFPLDFMFQLTVAEKENWISQIVISNRSKMGIRHRPFAFTENGVAMLSSVLRSERAIHVNIEIMRTFGRLKKLLASHAELAKKLDAFEKKYDRQFKIVFDTLRQMLNPPPPQPEPPKRRIGFHP